MMDFQKRVVEENAELKEKLVKLQAFIVGKFFTSLPEQEQERLILQHHIMTSYSIVLEQRIANF